MQSPYRDDLVAALARAEEADREVDRLEDELDARDMELERLRATSAISQGSQLAVVSYDEQKEITKLRLTLERTRRKLDKLRSRRQKWVRMNAVMMFLAALLGAALEFVLRR